MYIHLLSLTGPEFLQGSFPCKMQLLLGSKPGILYAESGYRGIRQTREGRVLFPHCVRSDLHENFLSLLFDLMVHMTT